MRPLAFLACTLLASVVAGCMEPSSAPAPSNATSDSLGRPLLSFDSERGAGDVEGRIIDDEARPIAGASIEALGLDLRTTSDADGSFKFETLPVGAWGLDFTAAAYVPVRANVTVERDATTWIEIVLRTASSQAPYSKLSQFEGHYTCAHEIPTWTGDCLLLYESQTGQNDPVTTEEFAFRMAVAEGWASVVLELKWTYAANNQLDGMRLYLENANGTETGHSYKVGRVDGLENPLRLQVNRGEAHPRADYYVGTGVKAFIPDKGELAQVRVFPRGKAYDVTSQVCTNPFQQQGCLLGVGVGLDVRFTVFASVFYRDRAPADYTATR